MCKLNVNKKSGSTFVIFIAIMFILFGLARIWLGFIGEKDMALITNIRRQGGERNDTIPNRYTYSISYSFTLPDGAKIHGSTYKIGNSVYVKVSGSNISMTPVRYVKALPHINALDSETGLNMGNIIIIGAGIIVIKFIRPRKKRVHRIKK